MSGICHNRVKSVSPRLRERAELAHDVGMENKYASERFGIDDTSKTEHKLSPWRWSRSLKSGG